MYIHPSSQTSDDTLQSEENAAIKIQAGFRGYRVRKQLNSLNYRTLKRNSINRYYRDYNFTENRTYHIRRHHPKLMSQLHDLSMGTHPVSIKEDRSMEDRCATKIQAGIRGFLVRKKQKMEADAATKIQAGFRGFKARKEAQQLREK